MPEMDERSKRKLLSPQFITAVKIYEMTEIKNETAWPKKIQDSLKGYLSASSVLRELKFLEFWHIVKVQFGETRNGRPGRLYYISNEDKDTIKNLYNRYWKE